MSDCTAPAIAHPGRSLNKEQGHSYITGTGTINLWRECSCQIITPEASAFILDQILSQGSAWSEIIPIILHQREAIRELFRGIDGVIFSGCGSG